MEHSTKMLGGIGYIVLIAFAIFGSFLPFAGLISLAAAICVMIAFIQAGNQLHRPTIKNDIIIAVVLYIVSAVLLLFVVGAGLIGLLASGGHGAGLAALGASAIIGGLIAWVLSIVSSWFWYKASTSLAEATGTPMFKTGGLLMFIGAILLVIGIGFILMLIGQILQTIAFFQVTETNPATTSAT
ncbi:MAG TPA: DUF996 domain-containing protein [Rhodanobacteraceae bacterium]